MKTTAHYGEAADRALGLWVKLARTYTIFNRLTVRDIATYGLTQPQFAVLEALGHLGPMSIGVLCKKMLVSGGNMTVVLDNLEREGLVERVKSQTDRRSMEVRLTEKGEGLFVEIFPCHAKFVETLAGVLSPEEQDSLSAMLKKFGTALRGKDEG